ncbi:MAG: peptidoglycan DD-metalloendopeptidase family protein [Desulfuromonadales bacterium]|nr:peptidoglycan DD-metalloendopeptidase family protein [Desulfuromonadales bacterium]
MQMRSGIIPSEKQLAGRAICLVLILAAAVSCHADIYRFVTVDGVESFTDAPLTKDAKVVIKEAVKTQKRKKGVTSQKVHNISLDEIVAKTVVSSINPSEQPFSGSFEPKLPPLGGVITSGVGMRIDPIDGKLRHHNGIDIAIPEGTPVTPVAPGVVVYSGLRPGYGFTVLVEHNNGMVSLYGHNSRLEAIQGQAVDRNTVIALSGNTGRSTGPHLHFEAWQAGINVTPAFMPGSTMPLPKTHMAAARARASFRKEILADGSVLFTNIPDSIH